MSNFCLILKSVERKLQNLPVNPVILLVLITFGLVYCCSLTFQYVEGDDARTIAYYITDHPEIFNTTYSFYHAGFDFLLSFLPPKEPVLRVFSMSLTALAQVVYIACLCCLILKWLKVSNRSVEGVFIALSILLVIPEFFFMGLLYNPTAVAMAIVMLSHLGVRRAFQKEKNGLALALFSALLFGLGVTFRWSVGFYGLVIFTDLLIMSWWNWNKIVASIGWGAIAVFSFGIWLWVIGVEVDDVKEVLAFANSRTSEYFTERTFFKRIFRFFTFYTPWMLFLTLFGFGIFVKQRSSYLFLIISIIPYFLILKSEHPKMMASTHPVFALLIGMAVLNIRKVLSLWLRRRTTYGLMLLGFLVPWIIGFKVNIENFVFGPGFEVDNVNQQIVSKGRPDVNNIEWGFKQFEPAFFDGFAMPTNEGPRPITGGYAGILLGGKWPEYIHDRWEDYKQLVDKAIKQQAPLLRTRVFVLVEMCLLRRDYEVEEFASLNNNLDKVVFNKPRAKPVKLFILNNGNALFQNNFWKENLPQKQDVILFSWDVYLIDRIWSLEKFDSEKINDFGLLLESPANKH